MEVHGVTPPIEVIFDPAATAAEQSTAAPHQRICAARQSPSGGHGAKGLEVTPLI